MPFSLGIVRGNKKREAGNSHIIFYKEAIDRLDLVRVQVYAVRKCKVIQIGKIDQEEHIYARTATPSQLCR
jgi:hypothetical protein